MSKFLVLFLALSIFAVPLNKRVDGLEDDVVTLQKKNKSLKQDYLDLEKRLIVLESNYTEYAKANENKIARHSFLTKLGLGGVGGGAVLMTFIAMFFKEWIVDMAKFFASVPISFFKKTLRIKNEKSEENS